MMNMEKAIKKITDEMNKSKSAYIQVVGELLLEKVKADPAAAEAVLADKKTIKGAVEEMRKEAEKGKVNNVGIIAPDEALAIIFEYFGINDDPTKNYAAPKIEPDPAPLFDMKLDDLL